jgi:glycosyltransferase involved in cell wall biosynthesis
MAKISVCITHYNRPEKLGATLASLAAQTRQADEVFLWDDCSPNDPASVIREWKGRFTNFVYHRNERNLGMPGNLNAVISQATGDYIANLHDADIYHPTLLEKWSAALDAHPSAGLVFCRVGGRNEQTERRLRDCGELTSGREFNRRYFLNAWRGSSPVWGTVMARRDAYEVLLPFDAKYGAIADVDMWMRMTLSRDAAFVNEELIRADHHSHFIPSRGVRWEVFRNSVRLHRANVSRFGASAGILARLSTLARHHLVFGAYWVLCLQSAARNGSAGVGTKRHSG